MSDVLLTAAEEAAAVARGEMPAASIWHNGYRYFPESRIRLLEQQLSTAREEERERCAKLIDELEVRFHELTNEAVSLKQDNRASRCGSVAHEMNRAARAIRSLGEKE